VVTFTSSAESGSKVLTSPTRTARINRIQGNFNVPYSPRIYTITPPADGSSERTGAPIFEYFDAPINANLITGYDPGPGHWDEVAGNAVVFHALPLNATGKGFASNRLVQLLYNGTYRTDGNTIPAAAYETPTDDLLRHYYLTVPGENSLSDINPVAEGPFYNFTGNVQVTSATPYDRATVKVYNAANGALIGTSGLLTVPTSGTAVGTQVPWTVSVPDTYKYNDTYSVYYETTFTSSTYTTSPYTNIQRVEWDTTWPSPAPYNTFSGTYTAYANPTYNKNLSWAALPAPVPTVLNIGTPVTNNTTLTRGNRFYYTFSVADNDPDRTLTVRDSTTTTPYGTGRVKVSVWINGSPLTTLGNAPVDAGYPITHPTTAGTTKTVHVLVEQLIPNATAQAYRIEFN
jgi:hypothetical protein